MKKVINKIPAVLLIFIISTLGFIIGVLTIALWQENWLVNEEILNREFIYRIKDLNIDKRALFFLCLGKRLRAFFILFLLAFSTVNIFVNIIFFSLSGLYIGGIMELFAIRYGMQGIVMYLSLVLPHGIFYVTGFIILGCWCFNLQRNTISALNKKKEKLKRIRDVGRLGIAFIFILIGIILECFVNLEIFSLCV